MDAKERALEAAIELTAVAIDSSREAFPDAIVEKGDVAAEFLEAVYKKIVELQKD